jgi:DNA repair exonuclease SbcCD nuclease subunit
MLAVVMLSDVHLEHYDVYPGIDHFLNIEEGRDIDIICLCGDIGDPRKPTYAQLIEECSALCKRHTFVIMGNHEAYGQTIEEAAKRIQQVCDSRGGGKSVFLNNTTFDVEGYRFIGTTLWSEIDPAQAMHIRMCLNDFTQIKGWGMSQAMELFEQNVSWLRGVLGFADVEGMKAVVLTHHAPLLELRDPRYAGSRISSAFASDLSDLIREYTDIIPYWFYGHNHYSQTLKFLNTTCMSNQVGYYDEGFQGSNNRDSKIVHLT